MAQRPPVHQKMVDESMWKSILSRMMQMRTPEKIEIPPAREVVSLWILR